MSTRDAKIVRDDLLEGLFEGNTVVIVKKENTLVFQVFGATIEEMFDLRDHLDWAQEEGHEHDD